MPKNKLIQLTLLIATMVVWGVIIFKIITDINPGKSLAPTKYNNSKSSIQLIDTYAVFQYQDDPFLKIITDTASVMPVVTVKQNDVEQRPVKLPEYYGVIRRNTVNTAILKINDNYLFLREKETYNDIVIKRVSEEELNITVAGKSYKIKRQKPL